MRIGAEKKFRNRGATIIESVLYVALLSFFILSTVLAMEQMFRSNAQSRDNLEVLSDAEFVLGKMGWIMGSLQKLVQPASGVAGSMVEVEGTDNVTRRFELAGGDVFMSADGGPLNKLNGARTTVTEFRAANTYDPDTGRTLLGVRISVQKRQEPGGAPVTASTTLLTTYVF